MHRFAQQSMRRVPRRWSILTAPSMRITAELLSSAFVRPSTGRIYCASENKAGLVEQADGGISAA